MSYRDREEIVTRIFDFTLLQDALSGFSGQFEQTTKEYWVLSRNWTTEHEVKWDYSTRMNISMLQFYQSWLVFRDLVVYEAERRLASRTAASVAQLLTDLNR